MSIVEPVGIVDGVAAISKSSVGAGEKVDFSQWLGDHVQQLDATIKSAEASAQALVLGDADNLHQVMINLSKAKSQFELTVEVRNRLVEGMQELLRMSV